ncbi:hypothetical protein HDU76_009115 [Blyttiomyces sp. JEL0837]|nr:hypothetical protein HDU76_009115 [Blyttiomyces sp. JEL0837]
MRARAINANTLYNQTWKELSQLSLANMADSQTPEDVPNLNVHDSKVDNQLPDLEPFYRAFRVLQTSDLMGKKVDYFQHQFQNRIMSKKDIEGNIQWYLQLSQREWTTSFRRGVKAYGQEGIDADEFARLVWAALHPTNNSDTTLPMVITEQKAASDYVASGGLIIQNVGYNMAHVPVTFNLPSIVKSAWTAVIPYSIYKQAEQVILAGRMSRSLYTKWTSEVPGTTDDPYCVERTVGEAVREFFGGWITGRTLLASVGANRGPATPGSTPDILVSADVGRTLEEMCGLAIIELKNNAMAPFQAYGQGLASAANILASHLAMGIHPDHAMLPIILTTGTEFQFSVVTALEPCGPTAHVLVESVSTTSDDSQLKTTIEALARTKMMCIKIFERLCTLRRRLPAPSIQPEIMDFGLSIDRIHFQPVRDES